VTEGKGKQIFIVSVSAIAYSRFSDMPNWPPNNSGCDHTGYGQILNHLSGIDTWQNV